MLNTDYISVQKKFRINSDRYYIKEQTEYAITNKVIVKLPNRQIIQDVGTNVNKIQKYEQTI